MQSQTLTTATTTRASTSTPVLAAYERAASSAKVLWATQGTLAVIFLFAGVSKLVMPASSLEESGFPVLFIRFIGVCETLGGLGLVLPGLLRIRTGLAPLAAAGLAVIMAGAVVTTVAQGGAAVALFPLVVGGACAFVAVSRSHSLAPSGAQPRPNAS